LLWAGIAAAQLAPTPDQYAFLNKCNPQSKDDLTKACNCLMQTIEHSISLREFNQLENREAQGMLQPSEISQKARMLAAAKPALQACMAQK
jgi:hypothetical protein